MMNTIVGAVSFLLFIGYFFDWTGLGAWLFTGRLQPVWTPPLWIWVFPLWLAGQITSLHRKDKT